MDPAGTWSRPAARLRGAVRRRPPDQWVDLALGLTAAALAVTGSLVPDPTVTYDFAAVNVPTVVMVAGAAGLSLAWRRRYPLAVLGTVVAAIALVTAARWNTGYLPAVLLLAVYAVGMWAPRRRAVTGLVGLYAVLAVFAVLRLPYFDSWIAVATPVIFTLPWALGRVLRHQRLAGERAVRRAVEAEHRRIVETERAVAAERLRMARELHDVVTHTLSVIAVQSGVARHLLGDPGSPAGSALRVIEESSRTALDDLRRMLGVLRSEDDPVALAPTPSVDQLGLLVSAHRVTHGPVGLEVDPDVENVSESARLTVFRLVQEALTNVGRHAPGAATRVVVRRSPVGVLVEVTDDGRSTAPVPVGGRPGYGLTGMRERVAAFDGTLEHGPDDAGGFRVRAELRTEHLSSTS